MMQRLLPHITATLLFMFVTVFLWLFVTAPMAAVFMIDGDFSINEYKSFLIDVLRKSLLVLWMMPIGWGIDWLAIKLNFSKLVWLVIAILVVAVCICVAAGLALGFGWTVGDSTNYAWTIWQGLGVSMGILFYLVLLQAIKFLFDCLVRIFVSKNTR